MLRAGIRSSWNDNHSWKKGLWACSSGLLGLGGEVWNMHFFIYIHLHVHTCKSLSSSSYPYISNALLENTILNQGSHLHCTRVSMCIAISNVVIHTWNNKPLIRSQPYVFGSDLEALLMQLRRINHRTGFWIMGQIHVEARCAKVHRLAT